MHEKILQGVTVGVVGGLIVFWLTSKSQARAAGQHTSPADYKPLYGDVRTLRFGTPSCADCQCCGLPAPDTTTTPLAADYLCCSPDYAPSTSRWNLGVSLQVSCEGIDLHSCITRQETASSFPYGISGPNTVPRGVRIPQRLVCNPQIPVSVECTEVI